MPPGTTGTHGEAYWLDPEHLRIARPARDLAGAEAFWACGLGLRVPGRVQPRR